MEVHPQPVTNRRKLECIQPLHSKPNSTVGIIYYGDVRKSIIDTVYNYTTQHIVY